MRSAKRNIVRQRKTECSRNGACYADSSFDADAERSFDERASLYARPKYRSTAADEHRLRSRRKRNAAANNATDTERKSAKYRSGGYKQLEKIIRRYSCRFNGACKQRSP